MNPGALKVAVVGGTAITWMAAIGLARALRHRGVQVTAVDTGSPADLPAGDWVLPSTRGIHKLLGLKETDLLRITNATFRLGTEHQGWQGEGSAFVHPHGSIGKELHGIPFYKLLITRLKAGDAISPDAFSLASAALKRGRFARPEGDGDTMTGSFTYGYNLPLAPYVTLLREFARAAGVTIVEGALQSVHSDDSGNVQALSLASGARIEADLFVDCSGKSAAVISQLPDNERYDWSDNLPCDRHLSGRGPAMSADRAATETRATDHGWLWSAPLANGSVAGYVYQSSSLSDEAAAAQLRQYGGVTDPVVTAFRSGRRQKFWVRNVVALGESAMQLEPLAGVTLHFGQLGLGNLIELFPLGTDMRVEAQEFNRVMGEHADSLRDFTLAQYLCATRTGAFWDGVRAAPVPERLAGRMDLFKAGGRILVFDQETFEEIDWAWLFLGSGRLPDSLEAQTAQRVARVTPAEATEIANQVRGLSESMPPHHVYLRHARQPRGR